MACWWLDALCPDGQKKDIVKSIHQNYVISSLPAELRLTCRADDELGLYFKINWRIGAGAADTNARTDHLFAMEEKRDKIFPRFNFGKETLILDPSSLFFSPKIQEKGKKTRKFSEANSSRNGKWKSTREKLLFFLRLEVEI